MPTKIPLNKSRRKKLGSMITLSTVLMLALIVLGMGFVALLMFMGGQSETKNASDAGALNVGKKAMDKSAPTLAGVGIFNDVNSDKETGNLAPIGSPSTTLRRINRIWAKAMLIAINAEAAGGQAGSGTSNASNARNSALQASNSLAAILKNSNTLHGFFTEYASSNSVRMLGMGAQVKVKPGAGWETSLMNRGKESNITLAGKPSNNFYMPPGYNLPANYYTQTTRTAAQANAGNKYFLKGYTPLTVGGDDFWQVPFLFEEKPHLVSRTVFDQNTQSASNLSWNNAVPNAFSVHGQAIKNATLGEEARSFVLSNPRQTFKMSMPQSYVHIKVEDPHSEFYFYPTGLIPPVRFGANQTYGFTPTNHSMTMPFGGLLCSSVAGNSVIVGLDVVGRTLDQVIFGIPGGNTTDLENQITARVNQIISKVGVSKTKNDMHACLSNPATIGFLVAGQRDFYIFTKNGEDLTCQPKALALGMAPWLATKINNSPDGTESVSVNEATMPFAGAHIPTVVPLPAHVVLLQVGWSNWKKKVWWEPGTGFNGNLGRVRVKRWTEVHNRGVCVPVIP